MKKLLSMILAVSLVLFSFAAFAETESVVEPLGGVIVEIGEEGLLLDQGDGNYVVVHTWRNPRPSPAWRNWKWVCTFLCATMA